VALAAKISLRVNNQTPAQNEVEQDLLIQNTASRRLTLRALRSLDAVFSSRPEPGGFSGERIAYVGNTHMGDVVVPLPYIAYFQSQYPSCRVFLYAHKAYEEVYSYFNVPVTTIPPGQETDSFRSRVQGISKALKPLSLDASISAGSERYYAAHLAQRKAGVPVRVGWNHKGLGFLLTHPAEYQPTYRSHQRAGALLAALSGDDTYLDGAAIYSWWYQRHPPVRHPVPTQRIGIVFEAQHGFIWSPERWDRLIRGVARDRPLTTFVLLGKDDSLVTSRVRNVLSNLGLPFEDRIGGTSLGGLLDTLRGLDGIVTVDTGVRHLGNLLGIPMVVIRHSQSSNVEWGPYGPRESVLTRPQPCSPCGLRPCKFETIRCMEAITSEEALEAVQTTIPGT
jgi:ADP-heptose:LPS heptosyltransferase